MPSDRRSEETNALPPGPFVGRRQELARLCRAVEDARLGRGVRFWVVGPNGVGKSRLLGELIQYAALRHVSVEHASSAPDLDVLGIESGLVIIDQAPRVDVAELDVRLCRVAQRGNLVLATSASHSWVLALGVPQAAIIAIGQLGFDEALRLINTWLGTEFDAAWAHRTVRSTGGHPGRMRRAVEGYLAKRCNRRLGGPAASSPRA